MDRELTDTHRLRTNFIKENQRNSGTNGTRVPEMVNVTYSEGNLDDTIGARTRRSFVYDTGIPVHDISTLADSFYPNFYYSNARRVLTSKYVNSSVYPSPTASVVHPGFPFTSRPILHLVLHRVYT